MVSKTTNSQVTIVEGYLPTNWQQFDKQFTNNSRTDDNELTTSRYKIENIQSIDKDATTTWQQIHKQ